MNILKKILFFTLYLVFVSAFVVPQVSTSDDSVQTESFEDSKDFFSSDNSSEQNSTSGNAFSGVFLALRMVVVLALVVAAIYGVMWFLKRKTLLENSSDPFLRHISSIAVAPGKSVQLITVLDKGFLIGVADNSVNLIGELTDKELINSMNLYADQNSKFSKPKTFAEILDIFTLKKSASQNLYESSNKEFNDMLKARQERKLQEKE